MHILIAEDDPILAKGLQRTLRHSGHAVDRIVHASAAAPNQWTCVTGPAEAEKSIRAGNAGYIFCGHVHEQKLYYTGAGGRPMLSGRSPEPTFPLGNIVNGWQSSAPPARHGAAAFVQRGGVIYLRSRKFIR